MKRRSLVGTRAVRHIMRFPLGFDFLNLRAAKLSERERPGGLSFSTWHCPGSLLPLLRTPFHQNSIALTLSAALPPAFVIYRGWKIREMRSEAAANPESTPSQRCEPSGSPQHPSSAQHRAHEIKIQSNGVARACDREQKAPPPPTLFSRLVELLPPKIQPTSTTAQIIIILFANDVNIVENLTVFSNHGVFHDCYNSEI